MNKEINDLTLLLLYLTSFKEPDLPAPFRKSWKGYPFEALNALEEQDFIRGNRRSKSVYLTEAGQKKAEALKQAYLSAQTKEDTLQELLNKKTREQLINCLVTLARDYDGVEEQLYYTLDAKKSDVAQSRALIQRYIAQSSPLSFYNVDAALRGTYIILETIQNALAQHEFMYAMQHIELVIEEMLPLFNEATDIDHEVSSCIQEAIQNVQQLCELSAQFSNEAETALLFEEVLKLIEWEELHEWGDWHSSLFQSAILLCDTPERIEQLQNVISVLKKD